MNSTQRREQFRAILAGDQCVHPASVFDPISARIAEDLGFELAFMAGSMASATVLGAPDLVVLAYGTNEAADQRYTMEEYRADLSAVLTKLRGAVTAEQVPCVLAGPSDRGWKYERGRYAIWDRTRPVAQVQREVAAEHGCAFWDWQAAMGGDGSMIGWYYADPKLGAGDFIHHTRAGYVWIADRFLRALDPGMAKR
jgi:lysophospholipase L1-like esterase